MDQYELMRTAHRVYKKSIRCIARQYGHSRKTVRKVLAGMEPKYRREKNRPSPVMAPYKGIIENWLQQDESSPAKQRHTARRIYTRLVAEHGFRGAEVSVRRWVRIYKADLGLGRKEAVIPLDPEVAREAEVDWGTAWARIGGQEQRIKYFCMRSRYSGRAFAVAYPGERQEMFFDAHQRAFDFFYGVFPVLVYDNLKTAVRVILRGKKRTEQERFTAFRSYYTYTARFCNPGTGREKGGVEGLIGYVRRNFLVPVPEVADFEELNRVLLERCLAQDDRRVAGREDGRTIGERHWEEQTRLLPLPTRPYENSKSLRVHISKYQTAQIDRNRYSVPTAYVGRWLWAQVGCERVSLYADQKKVADHARIFSNSRWQIDPLHYLGMVAERIGAFESARPIRQWRKSWPEEYETMLSILRRRQGDNKGTRDFVCILQLHGEYPAHRVEEAVSEAIRCHSYQVETVRHLLHCQSESRGRVSPLESDLIPGITDRPESRYDLSHYDQLLTAGGER